MPDAGWYRDPQDPSAEEYWDGQSWSGETRPSTGGQPGYGQPGDGQPGYGPPHSEPTRQVWGQRPNHYPAVYRRQAYAPGPATAARRSRTRFVVAGVVVAVLVAAGVVTSVLRSRTTGAPTITYAGKQIASSDSVLSTAQKAVAALVSRDHGATSADTRCYYAQPAKPAKGVPASDVIDSLRCGPVLFVDGDAAKEYLPVPLEADTSGTRAELTPDTSGLAPEELLAVPRSLTLVRPDDADAPGGDGGLSVPEPPPAQKDSIVAADLRDRDTPGLVLDSSMISKNQDVRLLGAGYVPRYGTGLDARSAPAGQRLVAFQISTGDGALGSGGAAPTLVVDGTSTAIPSASGDEWDVAAVPIGSTPVLRLVDDGFTQTLSLPAGKPGPRNIAVLTRSNTIGIISKDFRMKSTFRRDGASQHDTLSVKADSADLYFWSPAHPEDHPENPRFAYLSIDVTYTDPTQTGKVFGFDHDLLHLRLPDGATVTPRNLAPKGKVYNVFVVPADFTTGTLTIGGSAKVGNGIRQSLAKSRSVTVRIPPG